MTNKKNNTILIKTLFGLESVLASELENLGANNIKILNRAVQITGDMEMLYKCNMHLRTALAVYLKVESGSAKNQEQLYSLVENINWEDYFSFDKSFMIEAFTNSTTLNHSHFVAQKIKDGIVDYFRKKTGKRPNVNRERPDIKIYAHINKDICSLYLNSSGTPLYYRGYNKRTGKAPINDILAAGIIKLSKWNKKTPLYDPMCGCGTIVAEAYMIANNIPPMIKRSYFSFKNWKNYDELLWNNIVIEGKNQICKSNSKILCSDIDEKIISDAKINFNRIEPKHNIKINVKDFFNSLPPVDSGMIITNPPYGMRFTNDDIKEFYKSLGNKLKFDYNNYTAWIISSEPAALKLVGLRPERKITLFNGPLECKLNKYTIYKGSKKPSK